MFFEDFADSEGECYPNLPTKKGIGFSKEHSEALGEQFEAMNEIYGKGPVISDVPGWEKRFNLEAAECSRWPMVKTMQGGSESLFTRAFDWWKFSLVTNTAVTDGGKLILFKDKQVQRSGGFLTGGSNGIARKTCALAVDSVAQTAGDDCNEWTTLSAYELVEAYTRIGLPVRDVEQGGTDRLDFCSHSFARDGDGEWTSWLFAWERMLFESSRSRLIDPGTDLNWFGELKNHPDSEFVARVHGYIKSRNEMLRAVAGHDKVREAQGGGAKESLQTTTSDED